jgi:hypothetical protein
MSFWHHGRMVFWSGVGVMAPCCSTFSPPQDLFEALLEFSVIFAESRDLPPPRRHNHRIRLLPGTASVVVRSYRYLSCRRTIKRQCDEMVQLGIIREFTSASSLPVLLFKKQDNTWRFCIDYHKLDQQTVKDKFPIMVVDELRGARFFTKLDLRRDYHQVRMHSDDIPHSSRVFGDALQSDQRTVNFPVPHL